MYNMSDFVEIQHRALRVRFRRNPTSCTSCQISSKSNFVYFMPDFVEILQKRFPDRFREHELRRIIFPVVAGAKKIIGFSFSAMPLALVYSLSCTRRQRIPARIMEAPPSIRAWTELPLKNDFTRKPRRAAATI